MKVVNLVAGPGSGKSTAAAGLFYVMKNHGEKVELVREVPKIHCYRGDLQNLTQTEMFEEQMELQLDLIGQVEYCISDGPLLTYMAYARAGDGADYAKMVYSNFNRFENINIYVRRTKEYAPYGREQSEDEARLLDRRLRNVYNGNIHFEVDGDLDAPWKIYNFLIRERCSNSESL
jgi:thymidylate kinase